ncbi:EI24 domain-containing protein [Helicobacter sp. 11S02596-1]|uniref:EI24 domain-containing protein n=1 Tax=Helicobacter sp. 11S02596-1 TaxID=1476194 RepID=UPI000BA5A7DA|nr:EI24 domain-containing protein [Helicobacter sp. 11S02596-1]PAF45026.1 peptidase [Helicobacter sp. 11S02596-1]
MLNIVKKSWEDFFSLKMLILNIIPILIGVLFWGTLLFYFSEDIFGWLSHLLPTSWQDLSGHQGFFASIWNVFIKSLLYILLIFFIIILTLIGNVFISIFYTPIVIGYLHKKYYRNIELQAFGGIALSLAYFTKSFAYFILFALILTPLYFLPFIGIFAALIPHFFFFKNTMLFDVGSSIFEKPAYDLILSQHKAKNFQITALAYAFSLIPIFNFFATLLQTIIIARYLLEVKQKTS